MVLENIDDTDPAARVEMVRRIGHPDLKASIDAGHADLAQGRYGAPPVVDFIAVAADLLAHVHLQDVDGYANRHWHHGDGRIAWRPAFQGIAAGRAAPRLILEVRDDFPRLPQTVAALAAKGPPR